MRTTNKLDSKTGRFLPIPPGEKPPKMLREEERLDCKFEDDYHEKYISGELGQKRFAHRWNATKNGIFGRNMRGGRRSWIEMLELPRPASLVVTASRIRTGACAVCGCRDVRLENAHWIPHHKGGPALWFNLLKLCPNCHTKLDDGDREVEKMVKELLLYKIAEKAVSLKDKTAARKQLAEYSEMVMRRTAKT